MGTHWYLVADGKQHGPVAWAVMRQLAQNGRITANTPVKPAGGDSWQVASQIPGLLDKIAPAPSQSAPSSSAPNSATLSQREPKPPAWNHAVAAESSDSTTAATPMWIWATVGLVGAFLCGLLVIAVIMVDRPGNQADVASGDLGKSGKKAPVSQEAASSERAATKLPAEAAADPVHTPPPSEPSSPAASSPAGVVSSTAPSTTPAASRPGVPSLTSAVATASPRPELKTEEIVTRSEQAVCVIEGASGSGTGFVAGPGLVVTNAHVIGGELIEKLQVKFPSAPDRGKVGLSARLLYEDRRRDLAFLAVETQAKPLEVAEKYEFRRGQEVTVIGSPGVGRDLILQNAVSRGLMSTDAVIEGQRYYQLSIAINPGNSGGPVIDSTGQVVGVLTLKASRQEGLAFCVPLDELRNALGKASGQSPVDFARATSEHRASVVFQSVAVVGEIYAAGMDAYASGMEAALRNGQSVNKGVSVAREMVNGKLDEINKALVGDLKNVVRDVAVDLRLSSEMRRQLSDLWANYLEMKSYIDNPRGTYDSYLKKKIELSDKHHRLVESLKLTLGVPD